jgi:glycosyltransferase involved in cell wall biosynthesis
MTIRALLYGDVDLNLIDGSAIWLQSTAEVLARAGCEVSLVLKAPVRTGRLTEPLANVPGVTLVRPFEDGLPNVPGGRSLTAHAAARVLADLDATEPFDLLVVRGRRLVSEVVAAGVFDGRLWTYLTDIPQSIVELDDDTLDELERIAAASRFMLCQTEELRSFLESTVDAAAGRSLLFPPVVPKAVVPPSVRPIDASGPLRLVYAGKFAPLWRTLEMTGLPDRLAARGIRAELDMIGDKVHSDPDDATYRGRMEQALREGPGVRWHGGLPRTEAIALTRAADIALGWRDRRLDASLELSTKLLEYGSVGLAVVLNRTPMHEALLGIDYPLFASSEDELLDATESAVRDPAVYELAAQRGIEAARAFTVDRAAERLHGHLDRAFPGPPAFVGRDRPLRIGIASHDLKFFTRIRDHLEALPNTEVRVDQWLGVSTHDEGQSRRLLDWADVVVCEWAGPNAAWYSTHKRPGQRLIVRLHRLELYAAWTPDIRQEQVDQLICVSPHYARLTLDRLGWDPARVVLIPNWVDDVQLDRPKHPGAAHHLGLIGMAPSRKRPDLAVEILDRLRGYDTRYRLFVKSRLPWEYPWVWREPAERAHTAAVLSRIQGSTRLRDAVVFDRFAPDVASWLRGIGFVLSTSDDESFHLAPAEGAASGAVPILLNWPGADTIYDGQWIHDSPDAAADHIHAIVEQGRWDQDRALALAQVREAYGLGTVLAQWERIVTEDLPPWRTSDAVPAATSAVAAAD